MLYKSKLLRDCKKSFLKVTILLMFKGIQGIVIRLKMNGMF